MSPRRKTEPPTREHSRSSSSGRNGLIAKGKAKTQSVRERTALDNRFHRTRRRSRQAAECRARRPSRLVLRETDGVTPLADAQRQLHVHRGKRRAARPLARGCGLQLNV